MKIKIYVLGFLALMALVNAAGISEANHRKGAYNEAEKAYFNCLEDLPRAECMAILKDF